MNITDTNQLTIRYIGADNKHTDVFGPVCHSHTYKGGHGGKKNFWALEAHVESKGHRLYVYVSYAPRKKEWGTIYHSTFLTLPTEIVRVKWENRKPVDSERDILAGKPITTFSTQEEFEAICRKLFVEQFFAQYNAAIQMTAEEGKNTKWRQREAFVRLGLSVPELEPEEQKEYDKYVTRRNNFFAHMQR